MFTVTILALLVAVFALEIAAPGLIEFLAFTPALVFAMPWTFVTSIFLHGGLMHLFFNSFALLIFGPLLEKQVGGNRFLTLFLASGVVGNVAYALMAVDKTIPGLGASGAIFGVLGALAVLQPNLIVFVGFAPMPMWLAGVFWAVTQFVAAFNPYSNIAYSAHVGGLAFGYLYAKRFKEGTSAKRSRKTTRW